MLLLLVLATPLSSAAVTPGPSDWPTRTSEQASIQPSTAQMTRVSQLGATVRWNKWGTPQSLIKYGGWLATGLGGTPETAARNWIRTNRTLFRLTDADVTQSRSSCVKPVGAAAGSPLPAALRQL